MTINQLYEHPLIRDRVIKEKQLFLEKIPVYEENQLMLKSSNLFGGEEEF